MAIGDLLQILKSDPATDPGGYLSPAEQQRRQTLADALIKDGSSYAPVQHWTQGLARMAEALNGGMQQRRLDADRQRGQADASSAMQALIAGLGGQSSAPASGGAAAPVGGSAGGASAPAQPPASLQAMLPTFARVGGAYGITPQYLATTAGIESNGNPNARNPSGAAGMFQFMPATAKQYGLTDPMDATASADAAARLAADNKASLSRALGRDVSDAELYLAHQQGAGGAAKLLANANAPAVSIVGRQAVIQNGGSPDMTAGQFAQLWTDKYNKRAGVQVASADPTQAMAYAAQQQAQPGPAQTAIDPASAPMPPVRPPELTPSDSPFGALSSAGLAPDAKAKLNTAMAAQQAAPTQDEGDDKETPAPKAVAAATAAAAPAPAAPAQSAQNPAQIANLMRIMNNPYAPAAAQQVAAAILQKQLTAGTQSYTAPYKDDQGNYVQRGPNGEIKVINNVKDDREAKEGKTPATVAEYNFYAKQMKDAGQTPVSFMDYQKQKSAKFANFDEGAQADLVSSLATRAEKGDLTWKTGLARDPGLIRAVEVELARRGKASPEGSNAETILQNRANQAGRVREQGTLGTATANNTLYGNAAAATIDTAIQASRDVPRTNWVPVNKLLQMNSAAISDPKLKAFQTALLTTVNDYAKATTPTGTPTDSQRNHAYEVLNTAVGPEGVEAVLRMMHREIANTHRAIELTKQQLQSGKGGHLPDLTAPPASPEAPGSQAVGMWDAIKNATGFGGGQSQEPVSVSTPDEARKLSPGTRFKTPDGRILVR